MNATLLRIPVREAASENGGAAFRSLPALLAGRFARWALRGSSRGRVAAVFERCVYLENEQGGIACIGEPGIGAGPLNVLVAPPVPTLAWPRFLAAGQPFVAAAGCVRIAGWLEVFLFTASPWRPPAPIGVVRPALLRGQLRQLRTAASHLAPEDGLGFLVAGGSVPRGDTVSGKIARTALQALPALRHWLIEALALSTGFRLPPLPPVCGRLLGLGPGLTPSGDDLICGLLIALHALARRRVARELARWALPLARERTSPISLAHMTAAAEGEAAEVLHRSVRGLGVDPRWRPEAHLKALAGHGHTSGWDALAGVCMAMEAALPVLRAP